MLVRAYYNKSVAILKLLFIKVIKFDKKAMRLYIDPKHEKNIRQAYEQIVNEAIKVIDKKLEAKVQFEIGDSFVAEIYESFPLQLAEAIVTTVENENEKVQRLILEKTRQGLSRQELTEMIHQVTRWRENYCKTIAQSESTRAYNLALLARGIPAGAEYYLFDAVLDSKTTPQCRSRDGKIFHVSQLAGNVPPLHANCRSVLRPLTKRQMEKYNITNSVITNDEFDNLPPAQDWHDFETKFVSDFVRRLVNNSQF